MTKLDSLTVIRCQYCGAELAHLVADCVIVKRHGLEAVVREVVSLKCPDCKRIWSRQRTVTVVAAVGVA